jgi:hypothetical protein
VRRVRHAGPDGSSGAAGACVLRTPALGAVAAVGPDEGQGVTAAAVQTGAATELVSQHAGGLGVAAQAGRPHAEGDDHERQRDVADEQQDRHGTPSRGGGDPAPIGASRPVLDRFGRAGQRPAWRLRRTAVACFCRFPGNGPATHRLLAHERPPALALAILVLAAVAFLIGGIDHARLYHRGYAEVEVVGPLFLLNAIGTLVVILLLAAGRVRLFVLGVLAISLGSIVSIVLSHRSSFFGFAEGGWDADSTLILAAEIASVVLVLAAVGLGAARQATGGGAAEPARDQTRVPLVALAAVSTVLLAGAMGGIGTGTAPKNDPAPTTSQLAASQEAIATGDASVQHGKALFESQHCDSCHAIAATGAKGKLGPRMDAQDDPPRAIAGNITDPRSDIKSGYEGELMPTDYGAKMSAAEIRDLSAFIKAASTSAPNGGGKGTVGDGDGG